MKLLLICVLFSLNGFWTIFFNECNEDSSIISYKKNKEIYISGITSSTDFIKEILEVYKDTATSLLNEDNDENFKKGINEGIGKISSFFNMGYIHFDFVNPYYDADKNFIRFNITCPPNWIAKINDEASKEQVLISNKLILYVYVNSYIVQLKKNMESYLKKEEKNIFNESFYNKVVKPLLDEIKPIIANIYEDKKEKNKNSKGKELCFFDLPGTMFNFIDKNEFVKDFYNAYIIQKNGNSFCNKYIKKNEQKNEDIKDDSDNIINKKNMKDIKKNKNPKIINGLLWRIPQKINNMF